MKMLKIEGVSNNMVTDCIWCLTQACMLNKVDPLVCSWSRHDLCDAIATSLYEKQGGFSVEFLIQERLILFYGKKIAWKTLEVHGWIFGTGMTYLMQWEQVCMENQRDPHISHPWTTGSTLDCPYFPWKLAAIASYKS